MTRHLKFVKIYWYQFCNQWLSVLYIFLIFLVWYVNQDRLENAYYVNQRIVEQCGLISYSYCLLPNYIQKACISFWLELKQSEFLKNIFYDISYFETGILHLTCFWINRLIFPYFCFTNGKVIAYNMQKVEIHNTGFTIWEKNCSQSLNEIFGSQYIFKIGHLRL